MRKSRCTTWHSAVVAATHGLVCVRVACWGVCVMCWVREFPLCHGSCSARWTCGRCWRLCPLPALALRPTRAASCARTLLTVALQWLSHSVRARGCLCHDVVAVVVLVLGAPRACARDSCHSTHATSVGACFFVVVRAIFVCVRVCVSGVGILMANSRCLWPRLPPAGRAIAPCACVCLVIAGCRPTPARA